MLTRDEDLIHCAGSISQQEDDKLAAEEAGKSPEQIDEESMAILVTAYNRRGKRLLAMEAALRRVTEDLSFCVNHAELHGFYDRMAKSVDIGWKALRGARED